MHALITTDTVGGVWTYTRELVTGLARRGVRVTLVSFGNIPSAHQTEWLDALPNVDYRPTAFRLEWMRDAAADFSASQEYLLSVIFECKPELLHLNQYCYGALPVEVPRVVVAHSDVVSWWVAVHGHEPPDDEWITWYRTVVRRGLEAADAVVAPTQWMLNQVAAYYTTPARGTVIHNGRDPNLFNPHITKENKVLAVGRIWDVGKQVALLTRQDQCIPVRIIGSGHHPDAGQNADAKNMARNVQCDGPKSEAELRQLYGRAGIYAATSRYEPFGLAPLEAALSRCAIVANDVESLREVWGDAACYFQRNDGADLARVISDLGRDPHLRRDYANAAYDRARRLYNADRMVVSYIGLYESLVREEVRSA